MGDYVEEIKCCLSGCPRTILHVLMVSVEVQRLGQTLGVQLNVSLIRNAQL